MLVAAEGGQSTPGQPDRDTESIIGVDLVSDKLEVGGIQSVKHVESTPQCEFSFFRTELCKAWKMRPWWWLWTGHATCEDQSAEKLNGSGAASTRTAEDVTRCWEKITRQGTRARARRETDVEDVDCRNVLEHIHHALMIDRNDEYLLARAEGNSRCRKLDELLINHDNSWSTRWMTTS